MGDILFEALKETLVEKEHKLDQLDEIIIVGDTIMAIGVKDGKARVIYILKPKDTGEQEDLVPA